jgi:hypothetical protein
VSAHNITPSSTLSRFQIVEEQKMMMIMRRSVLCELRWEGAKDRAKIGELVSRPIEFPVKRRNDKRQCGDISCDGV